MSRDPVPLPFGELRSGMDGPERFAVPDRPIYTPPGGPPGSGGLSREVYGVMGEANIRAMIADLYARLFESEIAFMFPRSEEGRADAVERSAAFFTFLLGGPTVYQQKYGKPMMRARHLRFPIDERARRVWLDCFSQTLRHAEDRFGFPAEHKPGFEAFLDGFSRWMVNKADGDGGDG